jgi:hypothetical protein
VIISEVAYCYWMAWRQSRGIRRWR